MRYQIPEYRTCKEGYYRLANELNERKMLYYMFCKYYKVNIVKNLRLNIWVLVNKPNIKSVLRFLMNLPNPSE